MKRRVYRLVVPRDRADEVRARLARDFDATSPVEYAMMDDSVVFELLALGRPIGRIERQERAYAESRLAELASAFDGGLLAYDVDVLVGD